MANVILLGSVRAGLSTLPFIGTRLSCGFPSLAADYESEEVDLNRLMLRHPDASLSQAGRRTRCAERSVWGRNDEGGGGAASAGATGSLGHAAGRKEPDGCDEMGGTMESTVLRISGLFIYSIMANARVLMSVRVTGRPESGRAMEISRPGREPWRVELPAALDQGEHTAELVEYVTAQYLVALPAESIRLGWETIYALVRTALADAA